MIERTAVVAEDAALGKPSTVGAFCVLGVDGIGPPLTVGAGAVIRSHTVIYRGTTIGAGFSTGHGVLIRHGNLIGNDVSVGSHSIVEFDVEIEDGVRLHSGCFVPERTVLRKGAWIGPRVTVTNARYPNRPDSKEKLEGVTVEANAVIGAGAVLPPGIRIGEAALVGAGAVVVSDVPAGVTVAGNPARSTR